MEGQERIEVDPRKAFRERKQALASGAPLVARLGDPPPSLLGGPGVSRAPIRQLRELQQEPEGPDPYRDALRLRLRPGKRHNPRTRVRIYHILADRAEYDEDARCWAFTITRKAYERLVTERVLDSEGAVYPDGRPCVPPGTDPLDVPIRCGSCGTTTVECLQMIFFED